MMIKSDITRFVFTSTLPVVTILSVCIFHYDRSTVKTTIEQHKQSNIGRAATHTGTTHTPTRPERLAVLSIASGRLPLRQLSYDSVNGAPSRTLLCQTYEAGYHNGKLFITPRVLYYIWCAHMHV